MAISGAALLIGGVAVGLTSDDTPSPLPPAAAGPMAGAAGQPLGRIHLPAAFLGIPRNDNSAQARQLVQSTELFARKHPEVHMASAFYQNGSLGERFASASTAESEVPFSAQDRADMLAGMFAGPGPGAEADIQHDPPQDVAPGPLGGIMRCVLWAVRLGPADMPGGGVRGITQCAWLDANTYGIVTEPAEMAGIDLQQAAAQARQLRGLAETRP